jgi:hypothetical protein
MGKGTNRIVKFNISYDMKAFTAEEGWKIIKDLS